MWSIAFQSNATADALTVVVSVPTGPLTIAVAAALAVGWFVLRIYLTERAKSALAKHVDLDRFKKEQRKIDEAWREIEAANAERVLNAEMLAQLTEDREILQQKNAALGRALIEARTMANAEPQ